MNTTQPIHARRWARAGFTLVEAIVIIVILGIIAAVIAPRLFQNIGAGRTAVAKSNAASLVTAMNNLWAAHGLDEDYTIRALIEPPAGVDEDEYQGPFLQNEEQLIDPWGNEFVLIIPGDKNKDFDIVSYGADGAQGGDGEDQDIVKP